MIQICRAEDGQTFQVNATLWDLERRGSLETFLQDESGVKEEDILAYLPDGRRLRNENIRDLAGAEDQTIYVFNKAYLDLDLDLVLRKLRVEAPLQPPVEESISATPPFRPSQLASSYLRTAHLHLEEVNRTLKSLRYQYEALRIASSSLDLHVLAIQEAFEAITSNADRELEKQQTLLAGLDADLEIVQRVSIHKEFVSPAVRKAMEVGERGRTLGDYVSQGKMKQVAETCTRTHNELRDRLTNTQDTMARLREGTDTTRALVSDISPIEDAETCARRTQEALNKVTTLGAAMDKPNAQADRIIQEMRQLDAALRTELQKMTAIKNLYTERCINGLRQISLLNVLLVQLPQTLTSLEASFRVKTSFSHIQRLHTMLYAYGATVVEIVRRKEFSQFFFQRAQNILEVMTKMSANERKRRQVYRSEVHGQLPFETKGLDELVPAIDLTSTGSSDMPYSLERVDVHDLMLVLDDLERFARESSLPAALSSVQETRAGLAKLINKMDGLEAGFDRIAERSLLSSSRFLENRRRTIEVDEQTLAEFEAELQRLSEAKALQEQQFNEERKAMEDELSRLRSQVKDSDKTLNRHEQDLLAVRAQLESECNSRTVLEKRNSELSGEADLQRAALSAALAEVTARTREVEGLRQELALVRSESNNRQDWEIQHTEKTNRLLEDQAETLQRLQEAQARGESLEQQIQAARRENDAVKQALADASKEKDRLLRQQASEHDRIMRDHRAEADGDRAVLEHQYLELKAALDDAQRQLKDTRAQADMNNSDAVGLREELQRVERELREARHTERLLRDDLRAGRASQSDFEQQQEASGRLIAQILDVALAFREAHLKALTSLQTMTSHPSSKTGTSPSMSESGFGALRRATLNLQLDPCPIDPSDPAAAVEALRTFDHDQFLDAINKAAQTIRKWQRQCKDYREKAKGKISFRNFTKGDLALFLPTRNSVTKPWAAFNVSFPHYFLKPTGHLGEQLKTREWIVARITSITEGVVDQKDASTNPYGLGDGVKYYMLEVEDWTQPASSSKRRTSGRRLTGSPKSSSEPLSAMESQPEPAPGLPDPEREVEEAFPARAQASPMVNGRGRANSGSAAGPSSLSRLLAQAPPENPAEESQHTDMQAFPSPPAPSPQPSTSRTVSPRSGTVPLPHRPGSQASRISSSSRFSAGRIPFAGAGSAKAVATTALASEQTLSESPTSAGPSGSHSSDTASASPDGSPTEGMSNFLAQHRRRASSHRPVGKSPLAKPTGLPSAVHALNPANSSVEPGIVGPGLTARTRLASLASSWGVSFGRRRASDSPTADSPVGMNGNGSATGFS